MCDFCNFKELEHIISIEEQEVSFGETDDIFTLSAWHEYTHEKEHFINLSLITANCDTIKELRFPINRCPICGRIFSSNGINDNRYRFI